VRALRWAASLWIGVLLAITLLVGLLLAARLLLPLPFLSPPPTLARAEPADGASAVLPRAHVTLRFSTPMNRPSVERALRIEPPIDALPAWSDDNTTLTLSPTHSLRPDTTYRIALGDGARSRMFRAPERPIALSFRTAPAPAVLALLPPDGTQDVAVDSPISIRFSRAIVPTATLALPRELPELRFDPPLAGSATWLDPVTVLFRPAAPLRSGARYHATLAAKLTDLGGGELGRDIVWSFSTPPPSVLATTPTDGARWVAPRAPLALRLAQPLDLDAIRAGFAVTPTVAGDLAASTLPDATQWITFTPAADWQPGATYTAMLRSGGAQGQEIARWSFTAAPRPAVIGRFPGEGQTLPAGQDIRLIFNTPVDAAALRDAAQLAPPAGAIRVSAEGIEARIAADLRAATVYTLTLPAALTDANGAPFGREYQIRFVTAPAGSALELPAAPAHIFQAPPAPAIELPLRRTNLSALNLDLYELDEATTVRALAFGEGDWLAFQPERYGRPLLRSWVAPLTDTLNTPVDDHLPLALDGARPLPPGVYYLRIRTPEGPRADLLLLISPVRLALQSSAEGFVLWATNAISATPAAGLSLALYQDGALLDRGTTDARGLWSVSRAPGTSARLYVALAAGGLPAIASSAWGDVAARPTDGYRAWLTTDRAAYWPGEHVALAGFARRAAGQSNRLPPPGLQALLAARQLGAPDQFYRQTVTLSDTGVISAGFTLPSDAQPGEYILSATIGGAVFHTTFAVAAEDQPPLDLAIDAPQQVYAGEDAPLAVGVHAPEGPPIASATISWTLSADPLPFPAHPGYVFGDDEREPVRPPARSGAGQTDADGRFGLVITETLAADMPLRYRLVAEAAEPGGPSASAEGTFLALPSQVYAGLRLPSQVLTAGRRGAIEALAVAPDGRPAPGAKVEIAIYRRTWAAVDEAGPDGETRSVLDPRDQRLTAETVVAGPDGAASLPVTLRSAGEYRVVASVADAAGRRVSSAATLWVGAPGFTGWRADPSAARLIADRPFYRPGETASLLLAAPHANATALLTIARDGGMAAEVRQLRAGEPLTLTLAAEDAPSARVSVLLAAPGAPGATVPLTVATTTLMVLPDAITVTLVADRAAYAPGDTATLTVTTTGADGAGVPADVILSLAGAHAAPRHGPGEIFGVAVPPALATALLTGPPPAGPAPASPALLPPVAAPAPLPGPLALWNPALRTGAAGLLTLTVQLPTDPGELRALAWAAAGSNRFGQAAATLAVTRALDLRVEAPAYLRAGDEAELAALVRNTSEITQEADIALEAAGVTVRGASLARRVAVAPGATARVVWPVLAENAPRAALSVSLRPTNGPPQSARIERPISPLVATAPISGGLDLLREYLDPRTGNPLDPRGLRAGQLVRVRLTVVSAEGQRGLAIEEPLPGGATLVDADVAAFAQVARDIGHLTLTSDELAPGIYQYSYLLRAVAPGRFAAPAARARTAAGEVVGVGNAGRFAVSVP
jgi:alpha-2-macroglobulin